ncbi:MAG: HAD family phosphatase [Clostridia bacterium]|nr:HAD family phosphatase [Clostridia bacterium]
MIKLIVADFDGTLLPYGEKTVSSRTLNCIKSLVANGVHFAVASGRTYSELSALLNDVADDIYFICDDGALLVKNEKVLFKKQFAPSSLDVFFDSDVFKNATLYSMKNAYLIGDFDKTILYGKTPVAVTRPFEIKDDVFKATATAKRFDLVDTKNYRIHYSDGAFAEFVSPYANKGVAVGDLQLKLGVSKFDTIAIGDADNDIPMMSHAKRSWAVGNRSTSLKTICTDTADTAIEVLERLKNNVD